MIADVVVLRAQPRSIFREIFEKKREGDEGRKVGQEKLSTCFVRFVLLSGQVYLFSHRATLYPLIIHFFDNIALSLWQALLAEPPAL